MAVGSWAQPATKNVQFFTTTASVQRSKYLRLSAACDYGGRSRPLASLARKASYRSGRASR